MTYRNRAYWHTEGVQKTFTHPLDHQWLAPVDKNAPVLDLGCGYGRLTPRLTAWGFSDIIGFDFSAPLILRAVRENPGARYTHDARDLAGMSFGLVLCFALFTSCPDPLEQAHLESTIHRHSKRGALLYISDYETGDNPSYKDRYAQKELGIYGCFTSSGAVFRHHDPGHFDRMLPDWKKIGEQTLPSMTLNQNEIIIHQYLFQK